jgi:hypothetical protein
VIAMWIDISGFEGLYQVSPCGSVRNARTLRVLKPKYAGAGYQQVCLGAGNYRYVHRIVAQAFIPNPDALPQVNHLDGVKSNNAATNLEWCSRSGNLKHAYEAGLLDKSACKNPKSGYEHGRSRAVVMSSISGHIQITYPSIRNASAETGVDASSIHGALHGKFKQAGGWRWHFFK